MAHDDRYRLADALEADRQRLRMGVAEFRQLVLGSRKFRDFEARAAEGFDLRGGTVHNVVWFGRERDKVGMILFEADAVTRDGDRFPGTFTLIRGDASAVLVVLRTPDGAEWTPLVRQPRIAAGDAAYEEIPAGMVDDGVFVSTAVRELEEEVGADLGIREEDMRLLRAFHPSPGGSDEAIRVYCAVKDVPFSVVESLRDRQAGLKEEGERISVEVVPLHDLAHRAAADAKAIVAYHCYCALEGMVARPGPVAPDEVPSPGPRR